MSHRGSLDKYITVFSPEGTLYQVEYAFKAIRQPGISTVAVRGKDSVFVLTQRKIPDKLMRAETVSMMYEVSEGIGACITGRAPDGKAVVNEARKEAADYKYRFGMPIPVEMLAKRMGDIAQVNTQQAGMRPMGVALTLIGIDTQDNGKRAPVCFKVDPAGCYMGYYAMASGNRETDGMAYLEKRQKNLPDAAGFDALPRAEAAMLALSALQNIAGMNLKATDVEMGCVSVADDPPVFRRVADDEIEHWLTAIAERD